MDFRESDEEVAFRAEVRAFLAEHLPQAYRMRQDGAQLSKRDETLFWQRTLFARGWGAPHWPKKNGGPGWSPQKRLIFEEETAAVGAPWTNHQGINLLGPVVNHFGTEEQKARFIPPLLRGEVYWAQGFSEPGAGSDLAALQCSARREGDRYVVNGQKIWTSHALHSDWVFLLLRTARTGKKQEGISFMVTPIDAPGITVRGIPSIDGLTHLTEVFLDDVEIPADNLIGEEGGGWGITKHALGIERLFGACDLPGMQRDHLRLRKLLARRDEAGAALLDDPRMSARFARLDMEVEAIAMSFLRAISTPDADPMISSIIKVKVTELHQEVVAMMYDALGNRGPLFYPDPWWRDEGTLMPGLDPDLAKVSSELMYRRASSIYGGTNEVQRDILAKGVLGK